MPSENSGFTDRERRMNAHYDAVVRQYNDLADAQNVLAHQYTRKAREVPLAFMLGVLVGVIACVSLLFFMT